VAFGGGLRATDDRVCGADREQGDSLSEKEARQLLFDIFERIPLKDGEEYTYASLPDKVTSYVNEANRLSELEAIVAGYMNEECGISLGNRDPINFLINNHRTLRYLLK
jgi:hypothetical protein